MKKLILLLACCILAGHAAAQPAKEKLAVDFFTHTPDFPFSYVEMLRSEVRNGFIQRGRHIVLDAVRIAGMEITPEMLAAYPDRELLEQARLSACRNNTIRYLVWGNVSEYIFKRNAVNGKTEYANSLVVTLTGMDMLTGEILPGESFHLEGKGADELAAKKQILASLGMKIPSYINRYYKITGAILHIEPANEKGKYKELYIDCGSAMGVHSGDLFIVQFIEQTDGIEIPHRIGKLRVKEVAGTGMSRCTITSGGEEIAAALSSGQLVSVESSGEALF